MRNLTLANQLTILRIALVPAFVLLVIYGHLGPALLVFAIAGATDALDGLIARRAGQRTSLGAWLDPVADKLLLVSAFVILTVFLYQKGSPESRRPGVVEPSDVDPRRFADEEGAPWPVKKGGWILVLYEHSLGLALLLLFVVSLAGHAIGGWSDYAADQALHGEPAPGLVAYLASSRFWFESLQNWQSEFLSVGGMVWLSVYLRQRGSPESKPVHAPHSETGR